MICVRVCRKVISSEQVFSGEKSGFIIIMATPGPLGPNLQGMDSLTAAMKTNIIPDQEYLLQVETIVYTLSSSSAMYLLFV